MRSPRRNGAFVLYMVYEMRQSGIKNNALCVMQFFSSTEMGYTELHKIFCSMEMSCVGSLRTKRIGHLNRENDVV